jgi:hypothetical protein
MANTITRLGARDDAVTVYASAARTATPDSQEFDIPGNVRGLMLVIDVTDVTATPSVTFRIDGVDRVSGKTFPATSGLLTSAAITATGTTTMRVGPGLPATANVSANDLVPGRVRITATHGDADSITYTARLFVCR